LARKTAATQQNGAILWLPTCHRKFWLPGSDPTAGVDPLTSRTQAEAAQSQIRKMEVERDDEYRYQ